MLFFEKKKRIAKLRKKYQTLTHTSGEELTEIRPHPNVDQHGQQMGGAVFATSSDSDFYALRQPGKINYSIPYRDSDGEVNHIFIFEEMKDTYYEYGVSSKNFTPIFSKNGGFHGEWVSHDTIKPESVKEGKKEDILERTPAKVFTISNLEQFEAKLKEDAFVKMIKNVDTALQAIQGLVVETRILEAANLQAIQGLEETRILEEANNPDGLMKKLSKYAEDGKNMVQEDNSKTTLSLAQQAALNAKQSQH